MVPTSDNAAAIYFMVVASAWFGTSNAAREIVTERAIYLRERMVNLGLFNYIFSKYILLIMFCMLQCTVLLSIVFFSLGFHGGIEAFLIELANLYAVAFVSVAIGLLLSTMVASAEAAMALTPIVLLPQIILGGIMVPMTTATWLQWPMAIVPARWAFQGAVAQERVAIQNDTAWVMDLGRPNLSSPSDFIEAGHFKCATAQLASDSLNGAWGFADYEQMWLPFAVLGGMSLLFLIMVMIILKRRDPV
jgi:ABC-type multidrug transport system permease subunit